MSDLTFNAHRKIKSAPSANLGFENTRGCRTSMGNDPSTIPEKQSGFFLCASDRHAEFAFLGQAQRRSAQVFKNAGNVIL